MNIKAVISNFSRIPDADVFPDYYPYRPIGDFNLDVESLQQSAIRLSKYITYLGLKFKIIAFLKEAKEFENYLYTCLLTSKMNLFENSTMLGYNYIYGYAQDESITKLIIGIDFSESIEAEYIRLFKVATIVNSIYYEHIINKLGDIVYPNRLLMLKLKGAENLIEKLEIEAFHLSYKIGLKTGRLVNSVELNERIRGYKETPSHIMFINKTYHTDFLIQLI